MYDFGAVVGEEQLIKRMKGIANGGTVSHAYILVGEKRSGKSTIAGCFAKALMCESEGNKPCGMCLSCLQVDEGSNPDVRFLEHENPDTIGINDIREGLNDDIVMKPYRGERKVYIIDDAQNMTVMAQNALLKTLEEPPSYATILLLTTKLDSLLPTIQSRAVNLPVRPVKPEIMKEFLMRTKRIPDYQADICVAFARGNPGRALDLLSDDVFEENRNEAITFLKSMESADMSELYAKAAELSKDRKEKKENAESGSEKINAFLEFMLIWYRDALVYKASKNTEGLIFREEIQYSKKVSKEISYEGFEDIFLAIEKAKEMIRNNVNAETALLVLFTALKNASAE